MLLALISTSVLPISYGAMALIVLGVALLIAEMFVPSFGSLGIGGFIAFVLGSIFVVDPDGTHGLRVAYAAIIPASIVIAAFSLTIGYLVLKTLQRKKQTGVEAFANRKAEVLSGFADVDSKGMVRIDGEIWQARIARKNPLTAVPVIGSMVKIVEIDGLTLVVEPAE